ncbi:MAG: hypothetical protein AABW59_02555 [archaeon]
MSFGFNKFAIVFAVILLISLASTAYACTITIGSERVELQSPTSGPSQNITAENGANINVSELFNISSYSGSDCNGNIKATAFIYRYDSSTGYWTNIASTSTQTTAIRTGDFNFTWTNAFSVSSNYTRYRVTGVITDVNDLQIKSMDSYVDLTNNTCTGLTIAAQPYSLYENTSSTKTFTITNNTNQSFSLSSLGVSFSTALISSGGVSYESSVPAYTTKNVSVTLNAGAVSTNTIVTGTYSVSGYLGSTFCSNTTIGNKNFDVNVLDGTGTTTTSTTTPSKCADLAFSATDFAVDEGTTTQKTIYLKNNGVYRFELLDLSYTQNGIELSKFYNEQYAYPGELADIVFNVKTPSLTSDNYYKNTITAKGTFSDGTYCQFTDIKSADFNTLVRNVTNTASSASFSTCAGFSISASAHVNVENYGLVPITITNNTSQTATIYVESELDVSPTVIVLPMNSSISRDISFNIQKPTSEIALRAQVSGCTITPTTITVSNTAKGTIAQMTMSAATKVDGNVTKVVLSINNPTNKVFTGILQIETPAGWSAEDRQIVVAPGKNTIEFKLTPGTNALPGSGKATFMADNEKISADFSTIGGSEGAGLAGLAGLFGLAQLPLGIGMLLVIIIAAILIASVVMNGAPNEKENAQIQNWQTRR